MFTALALCALSTLSAPAISLTPIEKVHGGYKFTEGPAWTPEGLLFTDLGGSAIVRGDGVRFRKPTHRANGLAWDPKGRLLACEHNRRCVSATAPDGEEQILASTYNGKRLNSPNDLVVRKDGSILFTDPAYGLESPKKSDLKLFGVYAIETTGALRLLYSAMTSPNGIALAQDERTLYVADSQDGLIMSFDLAADNTLSRPRILAICPTPDGIKVGPQGEVWAACRGGIRVFDGQSGALLNKFPMRETPANLAFASDGKTLFLTAQSSLYKTTVTWTK